ncbi:ABC transporter substrate-binding protein [Arthrobacter gengyunqii]|uniref:Thiamine pyrimidine synthase n=1 Tax=Arthrobacter gengyunqii TaxID=2886940 RepID=A0A9X1M0U1_9MICC|nr:ABC transporter substrate-binding protein [Arthrobacter gengyunqii]MCC3265541.1 ABC transporter substrate-binding protein [Arthrobacter gengyunqii]MCC3268279.1 ABC transporter substrate-binding protein [Arthrobacter gengyunqii]UOY95685.1 ABC transporter substrate-binding protein [Arthrobacter gengyunqii]
MSLISPRTRRRTTARFLAAAMTASSLLLVTACAGSEAEAGTGDAEYGTLDVNLSWIKNAEFAGEYFADANGYYTEEGFSELNLIAGGPGGTSTETMLLSGGALVGTSSPMGVAPVIVEEDAPLKIIGTTYQKNPFVIISLDGNPITAPEDLEGQRIGVQAGVNETLFDALLEINGIDAGAVEKVPVQYDPQPLVNGDVDGFFGYLTNEVLTLELAGHATAVLPFADNGLPFVAESFVTTDESIATRREELKSFLRATLRGWKDAVGDAEESARLAVEVYGADLNLDMAKEKMQAEEQNTKLVVTEETEANGLFTISDSLIEENLSILKLAGYDLAAEDVFDMSLLAEVYEENPELK